MTDNEIARQKTVREEVLEEASRLVTGDRNQTYGSPTQNFQDTADVWNVILRNKLGEKITPGEVASMMIALKLVRQIAQPKDDNWVDIAGYAACGNEVDRETGRISDSTPSNPDYPRYYQHESGGLAYRVVTEGSRPQCIAPGDPWDFWEDSITRTEDELLQQGGFMRIPDPGR